MSIGYHYFETINQSLALQWFNKENAPVLLGRLISLTSIVSLFSYGFVWLGFTIFSAQYVTMYLICGGIGLLLTIFLIVAMPPFKAQHVQHKHLVLRKEYSLYYLLTFLSGARRQIFVVFAGFLMVEKFGYSIGEISALYMLNHLINIFAAPQIGKLISKIGERKALTLEYVGLIFVFVGYALVEHANWAAFLYVIDHLFFAMAIALKTYFQKIADPKDIASSAGVSFTINHIAAVVIPALFGLMWLVNPSWVFYAGALLALCSLAASQWVKVAPQVNKSGVAQLN
jgi:predicted MFS family arabinose efflux permease